MIHWEFKIKINHPKFICVSFTSFFDHNAGGNPLRVQQLFQLNYYYSNGREWFGILNKKPQIWNTKGNVRDDKIHGESILSIFANNSSHWNGNSMQYSQSFMTHVELFKTRNSDYNLP